ncbi:MAG: amidophosphoribosyltransferase [Fimbriimonadaceae bacterium]|nr:amidophosphoribosyltransferase [Fimbriimonadaceae bacterium]
MGPLHADVGSAVDRLEDRPVHECGVFGVWGEGLDVARLTYFGLFTLQHRGQESAGIAVSDGQEVVIHKQMGLVNQIFDEATLSRLRGHLAVGHVRYSTTGSSVLRNAQPILIGDHDLSLALAHNGNLVNSDELRAELERRGVRFNATSDSEVIARLLHRELAFHTPIEDAMVKLMGQIQGAYSLVVMTESELICARDPHGLHPLCIGRLGDLGYVVASETCALNAVGAKYVREVDPGEICIIDEDGLRWHQAAPSPRAAMCIFETIYFARPDSHIYGRSLHIARRQMGEVLAQESPAQGDVVIPVPDTGTPGAIGYAAVSHLPFDMGLVKSRYIQRTFIQPDHRQREMGAKLKYTPIPETLAGRRVVVVDDSIVRGTTTRKLVALLREAGAREVHLRIFSPPIKWPCFYGIDMATRDELVASNHSVDEIREMVGADSLGYLSTDGLARALGVSSKHFCWACLTGRYPIPVPRHLREAKKLDGACASLEDGNWEREPVLVQFEHLEEDPGVLAAELLTEPGD